MAETSNNPLDALIGLVRAQLLDVNTCIPGVVISYSGGLASVLPTGKKRFSDGAALDYPIIPGVRVCWPSFSGGQAGIKGPINPGDRCLLVFSQQAVDGTDDRRMFDLQDAYAVMCDLGQVAGDATSNEDMMMFFGSASIHITPGGQVNITAPGGTNINTPSLTNTGALENQGAATLSSTLGVSGSSTLTGGATIAGIAFSSHKHTSVTTGNDQSGGPV